MAQQGEADQLVNGNEGEDDNGLFIIAQAIRRRFPSIPEDWTDRQCLNDLSDRACLLKIDVIREKIAYEADPQNEADNFAFILNLFNVALNSLQNDLDDYNVELDRYIADNPRPECRRYCDPLTNVTGILKEVEDMIGEIWSSDLQERMEIRTEREIMQVVEGLPTIKISENHLKEIVTCVICLSDFEEAEEACQLRCDERHIFHGECIKKWLKKNWDCPICRRAAITWKYWTEKSGDEDVGRLRYTFLDANL